ncbi:MAG: Fe-S cluster assembly protein SufD [Gammaproteobacteria bacterium]|nr:Fe-S cluster assembly protein SufD [Gammaproteobacteria bacterium]
MNTVVNLPTWVATCLTEQSAEQDWLRAFQKQQGAAFLTRGFPSRREELWKYTDVSYLEKQALTKARFDQAETLPAIVKKHRLKNTDSLSVVFVNGHFAPLLSDLGLLPATAILCSLQEALTAHAELVKSYLMMPVNLERHPFSYLNTALLSDGLFLQVPKNIQIKAPIHVLYLNVNANQAVACPRNLIIAEEGSNVTLLEEHVSAGAEQYFSNIQTDIHTSPNAEVNYYKIQNEGLQTTHIAQTFIHQQQDSRVKMVSLEVGAHLARDDVYVNLNERGAECSINGFYALNHDDQHIDNHIQIDHVAPHGTSLMMYKGILDKKTHAVFNGKIFVHAGAQKTQSNQANHNLLLSNSAQVDTKPEFEIYADDVKCAHGDTVGQLDTESLFYLRSRGIEKDAALKLLTRAFADDVMSRITHTAIAQYMTELLSETLSHDN